jgi:hypothetical protein
MGSSVFLRSGLGRPDDRAQEDIDRGREMVQRAWRDYDRASVKVESCRREAEKARRNYDRATGDKQDWLARDLTVAHVKLARAQQRRLAALRQVKKAQSQVEETVPRLIEELEQQIRELRRQARP